MALVKQFCQPEETQSYIMSKEQPEAGDGIAADPDAGGAADAPAGGTKVCVLWKEWVDGARGRPVSQ